MFKFIKNISSIKSVTRNITTELTRITQKVINTENNITQIKAYIERNQVTEKQVKETIRAKAYEGIDKIGGNTMTKDAVRAMIESITK